jgi:hypothetical protein
MPGVMADLVGVILICSFFPHSPLSPGNNAHALPKFRRRPAPLCSRFRVSFRTVPCEPISCALRLSRSCAPAPCLFLRPCALHACAPAPFIPAPLRPLLLRPCALFPAPLRPFLKPRF